MASETVVAGLKKYGIGSKLRTLRLRKSMGLAELSKHTGLSPALLSKLERDLMHPTLPTLFRIAIVFSVGLEYFFNPESTPVLEMFARRTGCAFQTRRMASKRPITSRVWTSQFRTARCIPISPNSSRRRQKILNTTNTLPLSSCTSCRAGWNYELQRMRTSWPMATLSTSIALCHTATANSEASAPGRLWWCLNRERENSTQPHPT